MYRLHEATAHGSKFVAMGTLNPWLKAATVILAAALTVVPLTQTQLPPLVDLPNHLARMHLAMVLPEDPHLSAFYEYRWRFVPNLALDLVYPPMAKIFGLYGAVQIFLIWILLQIFLGVCLLRYAVYNSVGLWPIASFLFLYNASLSWGFLGFLFAAGPALIFFAVWIIIAPRGVLFRMALFSLILAGMFFLHLIAAAILCLCIGAYQLERVWTVIRSRREVREKRHLSLGEVGVAAVPIFIVLALWSYSATGAGEKLFEHRGVDNVVGAVFSPFLMTGSMWDILLGICVLGLLLVMFASKRAVVAEQLAFPCLVLLVVALVMPAIVLGVFGTHFRIPFLLACILVAGIRFKCPPSKHSIFALSVIAALFVVRMVELSLEWRQFDKRQLQFRDAIALIEPGSKVLTALDRLKIDAWKGAERPEVFLHMTALTVVEASSYDPLLFTDRRQQNVSIRSRFARIDALQGKPPLSEKLNEIVVSRAKAWGADENLRNRQDPAGYWVDWTNDFDYLIRFSFVFPRTDLKGSLKLLKSGDWFDLYKIERPKS